MRTTFILLAVTLLACGSVPDEQTVADEPSPPGPGLSRDHLFVPRTDAGIRDADAGDASVATTDSGDASAPDSGSSDAGCVDSGSCATRIGHCLTHMATLCYETSFDDTAACAKSGLSSGWSAGPCELLAFDGSLRSNGGCLIGCDLSYSYPLGGGPSTEKTRADAKTICEEAGGIYIDVVTSSNAGVDSGTN